MSEMKNTAAYTITRLIVGSLLLLAYMNNISFSANNEGSITELDRDMCNELKATHVMQPKPSVQCDRLRLIKVEYLGFDNSVHTDGRIMVLDIVAPYVSNIFRDLSQNGIKIEKINTMNKYDGDDEASMSDNNSSSFNDRSISGGGHLSLHAYGLAIDINPIQNPYLKRNSDTFRISPKKGASYINRSERRPGKAKRPGMAEDMIDIFANQGFLIWGGYWDDPIDYQHFQVSQKMANLIMSSSYAEAAAKFNEYVQRYRECRKSTERLECIEVLEREA
jgi:hypothetical protein